MVALALLAVTSTALAFFVIVNQIHFARALSNSMTPEFQRGDVLVLKPIDRTNLHKGDIALLPVIGQPGSTFAHRVIEVSGQEGQVTVRTKGDANPIADPVELRITSQEVPIVIGQIPASAIPFSEYRNQLVVALLIFLVLIFVSMFLPKRTRSNENMRSGSRKQKQFGFVHSNEFQNHKQSTSTGEKQ